MNYRYFAYPPMHGGKLLGSGSYYVMYEVYSKEFTLDDGILETDFISSHLKHVVLRISLSSQQSWDLPVRISHDKMPLLCTMGNSNIFFPSNDFRGQSILPIVRRTLWKRPIINFLSKLLIWGHFKMLYLIVEASYRFDTFLIKTKGKPVIGRSDRTNSS